MKAVYGAYEQSGRPLFPKEDLHNTLSQLGFTDIMHEDQEIPYHPWPENEHLREISRWFNLAMQSAIPAMSLAPLTRYAGWSAKEVTILNADVKREICMRPMEFSCRMWVSPSVSINGLCSLTNLQAHLACKKAIIARLSSSTFHAFTVVIYSVYMLIQHASCRLGPGHFRRKPSWEAEEKAIA